MKPITFLKIAIGAILFFAVMACKDKKTGLTSISGSINEVLVLMDKDEWNGPAGDTVKEWFNFPQIGLPQAEPRMSILNLPVANFDKNVKAYRNVLMVKFIPGLDSATIQFQESPWAKTQKYFEIKAPDVPAFIAIFDANKQKILDVFLQAEQNRIIATYKKNPDSKIYNFFKDKYHMYVSFPAEYIMNKDTNDFAWISRETRVDSRGVIFFQKKYEGIEQFNYQNIVKVVNDELKQYIPGPLKGTYMSLDTITPMDDKIYNYQGDHYAVLIRGLWMVVNDYMGGPFVLNVILDQKNDRVVYMLGYVYAPDDKKRNMMRQVEAILFTTGLDYTEGK